MRKFWLGLSLVGTVTIATAFGHFFEEKPAATAASTCAPKYQSFNFEGAHFVPGSDQLAPQVICNYGKSPEGYFHMISYPQMYNMPSSSGAWQEDAAVANGKRCITTDPKACPFVEIPDQQ